MKSLLFACCVGVCSAVLCAQDAAAIPDSALLLEIKVSDAANKPIANADIDLNNVRVGITDDTGTYYLPRRDEAVPSSYDLSIGRQGYETSKQTIAIPTNHAQWPVRIKVVLIPTIVRPNPNVGKETPNYRVVRIFYATNRKVNGGEDSMRYFANSPSPDNKLDLGQVDVSIPDTHKKGQLESANWMRMEFVYDPAKHVVMYKPQHLEGQAYYQRLAERTAVSKKKELFVFVHGYNVSFADGARRAAQLSDDLGFDGPAILYSWPSAAEWKFYFVDERRVAASTPVLATFLEEVARRSGAERIHLIAHSIGNRAMGGSVQTISTKYPGGTNGPKFRQIVMAAPDIKVNVIQGLQRAMVSRSQRVTMYTSTRDDALWAARTLDRVARVGEKILREAMEPGVDAVDATATRTDFLGHGYFAESLTMLSDLRRVLSEDGPPSARNLIRRPLADLQYWEIPPPK